MENNKNKNKNLLKEELDRFNSIMNYDESKGSINEMNFYLPEEYYNTEEDLSEADEEGGDEIDDAIDDVADEVESDEEVTDDDAEAEDTSDEEEGDEEGGDELDDAIGDLEGGDEEGGDEEMDMDMGDMDMDMGGEEMEDTSDDVEVDVTELVNSTEEVKQSSDMVNQKMEDLMGQFDQLTNQLQKMDGLTNKIDDLEHEMETRMPTPEEKLEMRSLDSYPYNVTLTDYWADKEGQYDVTDREGDNSGKPKEYVLNSDDVDSDYDEMSVKRSLENPYEEEDIH